MSDVIQRLEDRIEQQQDEIAAEKSRADRAEARCRELEADHEVASPAKLPSATEFSMLIIDAPLDQLREMRSWIDEELNRRPIMKTN